MKLTNLLRHGAASVFLLVWPTGCASNPPTKTRVEYVDRPIATAVPARLTEAPAEMVLPDNATNDDLLGYAEGEKCRHILAACQLERIEALQPGGARRPARWCVRYSDICGGAK